MFMCDTPHEGSYFLSMNMCVVPPPTIETFGPMNITDGESTIFICTATSFSDNITVSWLDDGGESVQIKLCKLHIHNTFKGETISNVSSGYSIEENLITGLNSNSSSQFVSRLSLASFSLAAHLHRPLTCVGRVGNPVVEHSSQKDVPDPQVQCKACYVHLY